MKKFFIATAAVFTLLFSAIPSFAGTSGFSAQPGAPDGSIDTARSRFSYQLAAGNTATDQIYVSNTGSDPISLTIYANDAKSLADGTFDVKELNIAPTDVASWIKFSNGKTSIEVRLGHDEHMIVPFTIAIPTDAQPGDHTGGIAVATASQGSGQIQIARRIVTRLYARIPGDLKPALTVSNLSTRYDSSVNPFGGTISTSFTITNGGNVSLKADAVTSASTVFGIPIGTSSTSEVEEITPGASRTYAVTISSVGQWFFIAPKVTLTPKVDNDALDPGVLAPVVREDAIWVLPYTWLSLLLMLVAILLAIRARTRRRRKQVAQWLAFADEEAKAKASTE